MDNEHRYFPSRAMISEPSSPLGDININFEVIANIVRLTVSDIQGIASVGGQVFKHMASFFTPKRDVIDGVYIEEDGDGYAIKVRVQVFFGTEIPKVAYQVQDKVRQNLAAMASVNVTRVDVVVDGIVRPKSSLSASITPDASEKEI